MTYTITRPVMTREELADHEAHSWGRDYSVSDDGYSDMEAEQRNGWHVVSGWGRDGWDLGGWPYVAIYVRTDQVETGPVIGVTVPSYKVLQIVEGDRTLWEFTSEQDRDAAIDYLFLWYAASNGDLDWVDREALDKGELVIGDEFRGPFSWARLDEDKDKEEA